MGRRITVAVIDDHPMFREGVVQTLKGQEDIEVVGQGATAQEAIRMACDLRPDVLLLDMKLPGGGMKALSEIVTGPSLSAVMMLTVVDNEEFVADVFRIGGRGYMLKDGGGVELVEAVKTVANGERHVSPRLVGRLLGRLSGLRNEMRDSEGQPVVLTSREKQVYALLARGLRNKEIAFQLDLSEKTVKFYLTNLLRKLQVRNRVEAAVFASQTDQAAYDHPQGPGRGIGGVLPSGEGYRLGQA